MITKGTKPATVPVCVKEGAINSILDHISDVPNYSASMQKLPVPLMEITPQK